MRQYNGETKYDQPFCHYGTRKPTDAEQNRDTTVPLYEAYFPKCQINSWTTFGLGYTYTGIKNLILSVNIKNLFDEKAPYVPFSGVNTAGTPQAGYSEGLHSNQGRYFNLNATYKF
jgi:iron complex outermembrane receptor protein